MRQKLIYQDLTYEINGILFSTHNDLGRYKNEQQCADAIEQKLKENKLNYKREYVIPASFDGEAAGRNKVDFLIEDKIILEIKAKNFITKEDYYQIRRYLDSANKKLGLLINFRNKSLRIKRILNSKIENYE